jgi:energy-converting hydrogenase Eha subunit C
VWILCYLRGHDLEKMKKVTVKLINIKLIEKRFIMMQQWADYLDVLKAGDKVLSFKQAMIVFVINAVLHTVKRRDTLRYQPNKFMLN